MRQGLTATAGLAAALLMGSAKAEVFPPFAFDHYVTVLNDSSTPVNLSAGRPGMNGELFSYRFVGGQVPSGVVSRADRQSCFVLGKCPFVFADGATPRTQSFQFTAATSGFGEQLTSLPGTVFIKIVQSIDGPLVYRQDVVTVQNQWAPFAPQGIDPAGMPLTFSVATDPGNGSLRANGFNNGGLIYEPHTDFTGVDLFSLVASNDVETSPAVEFSVTVRPANAPAITRITPEAGTTIDISEVVIEGQNFVADGTTVLINGIEPITTQTRLDGDGAVEVIVTFAPQAPGRVPVTVTTDAGSSTHILGFQFGLPDTQLVSAVLPLARSVSIGTPATAFASVINAGNAPLSNCTFITPAGLDGKFHFQTTDPRTNALTGTEDAAVNLGPLEARSYVFSVLSSSPIAPMEIPLEYGCDGQVEVSIIDGVNVFRLTVDTDPVPDVIAGAGVPDSKNPAGTLSLPGGSRQQFFVVATSNIGADADITVTATVSESGLPITIQACSDSADCFAATSNVVQEQQLANSTAAYFFLISAQGEVPFDPAVNRINVEFTDSAGVLRGATSVAVTTRLCSLDDEVLCALLP